MHGSNDLPQVIAGHLRNYARSAARRSFARSTTAALCVFILWALASCGVDRLLQLSSHVRLGLLLAGCALGGLILLRALWRLREEIDWVATASQLERCDPRFDQRLVTVVSQLAGPRDIRGSDEIIAHILTDVESQIAAGEQRSPARLWRDALPWLALAAAIIGAIALDHNRATPLRQLAMRFVLPLKDIPPVTTAQIQVSPGDRDILQSQALRIDAQVDHLRGDSVFLSLNTQGNWYRVAMNPVDPRHYSYTLWSVDRDVRYYVSAGDAVTPHYLARVLRPPGVSKFQISYTFPAYVGQAPMTVTNSDGRIEAPVDTDVTLKIFCSEPLQSAMLAIGSTRILMSRTDDDAVRSATFKIRNDSAYSIDLISEREVAGAGPAGTRIRALLNQPPIARLLQGGEELRLTPRDIASLDYAAADDYALASIALRVQVNDSAPIERTISLLANRRGQQGRVVLDLATLPLKIGDVVNVWAVATDSAGQGGVSKPLRIAISAQSIDPDIQQRVAELNAAAEFAAKMTEDFVSAGRAAAQADGMADQQSPAFAAASAQANLALANASESATLLRQSLCRALLHTRDDSLCVAMAGWIDSAQTQSQTADELFRERGDAAPDAQSIASELQRAAERGRALADEIRVAAAFQQAVDLSAERQGAGLTDRDLMALRQLGISPGAADIDAQLRARIDAGETLVRAARPIDFAAAARDWAEALQREEHAPGLRQRLSAAAEAEAVRPDADLLEASDLQLASRAAGAIEASLAQKQPEASDAAAMVSSFAKSLAALQSESALRAGPHDAPSANQTKTINAAASAARVQMAAWESDAGDQSVASALDLALQASAAAAIKDYDRAKSMDEALVHRVADTPAVPGGIRREPEGGLEDNRQQVARSMADARALDGIGQMQDAVTQQTPAADHGQMGHLADQERSVTAAIAAMITERSGSTEETSHDREALAERDPLVAAKYFAGAAANSLTQTPPDVSEALQQESEATGALSRAWDQSIHDAALCRLEIVPAMQPVCAAAFGSNDSPLAGDTATAAGGWGSLQPRDAGPLNLAARDSDPAGYEDSLRIYFQALAKAQAARTDAHPSN
jgi:hypothetical protein